ncbi:MAG: aminotransferase class V-fold PLP-dependent enzyme [Archangium sp.]|nr:aminotransferase class V-fold PLP-dependent enzyme [Archangium sp.]
MMHVMTPSALRSYLPALNEFAWLNAAASSPTPQPVFDAMKAFLDDTLARGDVRYPAWAKAKDDTRAHLARFLNVTPKEVGFVQSTSFGFHVIAQLLKQRGITEVLTVDQEFPSTTLPMLYDGLTLRAARTRADGSFTIEDLEAALTRTTGAIAISAVQFASGFRIDLSAVSQLCKAKGLAFIINAAQGIGHVPLDLKALDADFLAATSHKWLAAGYGTGMLFVAQRWLETTRLPFGGWLSVEPHEQFLPWMHADRTDDAHGFTAHGTKFRAETSALEAGGGSWLGLVALDAALTLHDQVGVANTLTHAIKLQLHLRAELRKRGFTPNTPDDPGTLSGICVVPVEGPPIDVVRALLKEAKVSTTARGGGVRISTHVYNDEGDLDRLLSGFEKLGVKPGRPG